MRRRRSEEVGLLWISSQHPFGGTIIKCKYNGGILKQSQSRRLLPAVKHLMKGDTSEQHEVRESYGYDSPTTDIEGHSLGETLSNIVLMAQFFKMMIIILNSSPKRVRMCDLHGFKGKYSGFWFQWCDVDVITTILIRKCWETEKPVTFLDSLKNEL